MVGLFICCISGFPRENEQEDERLWSKRHSKEEEEENPFAARGLKQFCALLAEIEEKRQRIYSEVGAEAISLIQFVYSTDNQCKPIVVKAKKGEKEEEEEEVKGKEEEAAAVIPLSAASDIHVAKEEKPTSSLTSLKVQQCYWLPLTFVMASLLLALFGRSAAILCASIVWYLVPNSSLLAQNESTSASASASMMKKKLDNGNRESIKKKMLAHRFCSFNMSPVKAKQHTRGIGRRLLRSHSMHA